MIWYPGFYIFLLFLTYAILRYVLLGPVEATEIPLYLSNKAFAWTSLTLMLLTISGRPHQKNFNPRVIATGMFLSLHLLSSLILLNPHYYPKFFEEGALGLPIQISLIAACTGLVLMIPAIIHNLLRYLGVPSDSKKFNFTSLNFALLILCALHLILIGYSGWIAPSTWHGYLPPISLICFIQLGIGSLLIKKCS